jgi:hypothetical protein
MRGIAGVSFMVRNSDMIIAHSMTPHGAIAFGCSRPETVRVWSGWGFDYYGSDESPDAGLLGASTLALSTSLDDAVDRRLPIRALSDRFLRETRRRLLHHAAGRADYFSAPIPDDLSVFTRRFPEFDGSYSQISYGNVAETFACDTRLAGTNILVGNSATPSNNHLEIFDCLARLDLSGRRIIVPLSYGDLAYRDAIVSRGCELFGSAFTPLIDFLPQHEYAAITASCNIVVMNHKRQQALGNIGAGLYQGAHVFLDEACPTVDFLRSRGAFLYTTNQLKLEGLPKAPLSLEVVASNRGVLEALWGAEQVVRYAEALVSRLDRLRPLQASGPGVSEQ